MSREPPTSAPKIRPIPFDLEREDGDGAVVLRLFGELDIATCARLERALVDAEQSGTGRITVDLGGLRFIDSAGLRVLAQAHARDDGRLRLLPGSGVVQRVFALTGFDAELPFET